jgi:hypothetical protein
VNFKVAPIRFFCFSLQNGIEIHLRIKMNAYGQARSREKEAFRHGAMILESCR